MDAIATRHYRVATDIASHCVSHKEGTVSGFFRVDTRA